MDNQVPDTNPDHRHIAVNLAAKSALDTNTLSTCIRCSNVCILSLSSGILSFYKK